MNREQLRNAVYYQLKPLIPRSIQIWLRSQMAQRLRAASREVWPIDAAAAAAPAHWPGWPDGKRFAFVLMHDVETADGQSRVADLAAAERERGMRSSFNFVPERYAVSADLRHALTADGFEVGVHGLNHDGKLYQTPAIFAERAERINGYLKAWGATGFCSPASHHRLSWNHALHIAYDSSTFDTDPFEPESDGVGTIFPFPVYSADNTQCYVELPYTLPQDFTLFILLKERDTRIWRDKVAWIAEQGGMALVITHPDYIDFDGRGGIDKYPLAYYAEFLDWMCANYSDQYWHALPREVAAHAMRVAVDG